MCGIVGVAGKLWKKEEDVFKSLLELDTIRGPHSTGVISVNTKDWEYLKSVGTPWDLYGAKGFDGMMKRWHKGMIGHNRWATVGKITEDNAHPFHHGDFVGVHNGTLRTLSNMPGFKKFETDSEMIYHSFAVKGVDETIKELNGAFALAWYNNDNNSIQLCRNEERPLMLCRSEDGKTCFFASEAWMLRVALSRHGVNTSEPVMIEPGTLVTLPLDGKADEPLLPRIRKLPLYTKPPEPVKTAPITKHAETQALGGGGNILPFNRKVHPDARSYREYVGKVVTFSCIGEEEANKMKYISCQVEDQPRVEDFIEIRVFQSPDTKIGKWLLASPNFFKAKVKKITFDNKFGKYLSIDVRTMYEVKPTTELLDQVLNDQQSELVDTGEKLVVYGGREVNLEEWFRQTAKGCGWCSAPPSPEKNDELHWYAAGQFLCKHCKEDPEVSQYLQT